MLIGIVEKLDGHYGFQCKNCFSLAKLLYFLRNSTCFNHPALLEKYDKTVRNGLSKVCNVNFDDISSTQLALPAEMCGLGVSSASFEDVSFTKALNKVRQMNNKVFSMEPGKIRHKLSTSTPPKIAYDEINCALTFIDTRERRLSIV